MTNREHFIATLQACYFGDRNAFEEIIRMYDEKENIIKEVREYIEERRKYKGEPFYLDEIQTEIVCEILDKENK